MALFTDPNLGGLRIRVQFRLQNDPRFTDSMVNLALNKAVVRLLLFIRDTTSIYTAQTFVLTTGQFAGMYAMEYPLPPGTLWVDSLSFAGQQPMRLMSEEELANTGIETSNGIGDPSSFYVRNNPDGTKTATIYPRPGRVATLEFYGGVTPPPMVKDIDPPPVTEAYFDALEKYAIQFLADGQEGMEAKVAQAKEEWLQERSEARVSMGVNRVFKTIRTRDIP